MNSDPPRACGGYPDRFGSVAIRGARSVQVVSVQITAHNPWPCHIGAMGRAAASSSSGRRLVQFRMVILG